jgi:hypothetical protein
MIEFDQFGGSSLSTKIKMNKIGHLGHLSDKPKCHVVASVHPILSHYIRHYTPLFPTLYPAISHNPHCISHIVNPTFYPTLYPTLYATIIIPPIISPWSTRDHLPWLHLALLSQGQSLISEVAKPLLTAARCHCGDRWRLETMCSH